ncbi:MAG TPA: isoamylase early set domain-containing protein [Verrucomicrobiae bacterium]|nr:isoamylase early set domain-containing protein [Verrucomicrobiae bacterium]
MLGSDRGHDLALKNLPAAVERLRRGGASLAHDCRVVFRLIAPRARSVKLAADFTDWEKNALSLQRGGDGEWEVRVTLAPGRYGYRYLVDGKWEDDPHCPRREPNPFGTANAVAEVQ